MTKIETIEQYEWAMDRVEQLLPLVDDDTPASNPYRIELGLLSNLVADYSDIHFAIGNPPNEEGVKSFYANKKNLKVARKNVQANRSKNEM